MHAISYELARSPLAGDAELFGPVFGREAVTLPRRPRHFLYRSLYVTGLLLLMCTAWLRVTGTQIILNVGDMARFGSISVPDPGAAATGVGHFLCGDGRCQHM